MLLFDHWFCHWPSLSFPLFLFLFLLFSSSVFSSLLFVPSANKHYWAHTSFRDKMELLVMEYLVSLKWFMVRDLVDYSALLWSTPLYLTRFSMKLPQVKQSWGKANYLKPVPYPPYTLSSLISDFGDWLVSFIWTSNTEGNPFLCGHGIEWELF